MVSKQILVFVLIAFSKFCHSFDKCRKSDRYCGCDEKCILYGDCCFGHKRFNESGSLQSILSCKEFSISFRIWVIDKCQNRNHKMAKLCSRKEMIPENRVKSFISVITDDDQVYENAFCAICNDKTKFKYLNTSVTCFPKNPKTFEEVNLALNKRNLCTFKPTFSNRFRLCNENIVRKCPKDYNLQRNYDNVTLDLCENKILSTFEEYTDGRTILRNSHCCKCWNKTCFRIMDPNQALRVGFTYLLNYNEWNENEVVELEPVNATVNGSTTDALIWNGVIYYTSFIFTLISIISLIILIIIYSSNVIFHNFGGYLTICLSCCLLLMNLIIIMQSKNSISTSYFCKIVGILQHYIALSNFVWMSIYALDLLQTFGFGGTNQSKKKSFKTFLLYCLVGFGLSALIVGASTIIEFNTNINSTLTPKYGGQNCWFTSRMGGIIWYFAPVCLLLLWNFGSCVVVFFKLSKTANECRVVQQSKSSNSFWLCVRLTAVFGIGYIFQIIAVFSGVKGIIILGSMINCLQGFLLSVCFVWTKRVRNAVSSSFSTFTGSNSSSSNATSQRKSTKVTQITNDNDRFDFGKESGKG